MATEKEFHQFWGSPYVWNVQSDVIDRCANQCLFGLLPTRSNVRASPEMLEFLLCGLWNETGTEKSAVQSLWSGFQIFFLCECTEGGLVVWSEDQKNTFVYKIAQDSKVCFSVSANLIINIEEGEGHVTFRPCPYLATFWIFPWLKTWNLFSVA